MIKLEKLLDLDGNKISDISALKNMINLNELDLDGNEISDISVLSALTDLTILDLHDNEISDISALKDLVNLTDLDLDDNQISNISALNALTNLTVLDLDGNQISNVFPLKGLINLTELDLHDNRISDISALKNLVNLTVLDLSENHISDFSPIAGLIDNLTEYDNSKQTDPPTGGADVNRDGVVNLTDLLFVVVNYHNPDFADSAQFGVYPDINEDGVVDIKDWIAVAAEIDADAAAPTLRNNSVEISNLTAANLAQWIALAKRLDAQDPQTQKGLAVLKQLLAALTFTETVPKTTALLANYPNPFNPETWMPYQLAEPAEVSISIHSADGKLVRTLALGQLPIGVYYNKSRAAHWDGRNAFGESVASGIYFYTLTAGDFTATGKMIIRK